MSRNKDVLHSSRLIFATICNELPTAATRKMFLLFLAYIGKEREPEPALATISQETLAEMIGTTRTRVSFLMNKFRKLGFIEYNGGLTVHSSLLNIVLHD